MAGTITHAFFAKDVLKQVSKKRKIIFDENYVNIFAQSMDPFNFYSILFPILPNSKEKRNFSSTFHTCKVNNFFETLIVKIKNDKLSRDKQVMSFLFGFISHYVLDSALHPYVEYKTGKFKKSDKNTYKYNALHHEMETFLDIYLLRKNNISPHKFKSYNIIFKVSNFNSNLNQLINYTFESVYDFKDFSKYYLKSIKDMKLSFRLLRYDPLGYKKYLYAIFDFISPKSILNSKFLSYSYVPKNAICYLNNEHNRWNYPFNLSIKSKKSFDNIYEESILVATNLIIKVIDYIEKNKELDINSLFNLSYVTGLDWKIPLKKPKFEF